MLAVFAALWTVAQDNRGRIDHDIVPIQRHRSVEVVDAR